MFLYPEIIFHTGTVNILFVQEKNQWVVKSSELQCGRFLESRVRLLWYLKGLYVLVNQCYVISIFPESFSSLWTRFLPQKKTSWKCILVIQLLKIPPVYQHFARNIEMNVTWFCFPLENQSYGGLTSNIFHLKII